MPPYGIILGEDEATASTKLFRPLPGLTTGLENKQKNARSTHPGGHYVTGVTNFKKYIRRLP